MRPMQVRMNEELYARATEWAKQNGLSLSTWVRLVIEQALAKGSRIKV